MERRQDDTTLLTLLGMIAAMLMIAEHIAGKATRDTLFLVGLFGERGVQFHPTAASHVGEQDLCIQARRLTAALPKEIGCPLEQPQHRPWFWRRFLFPRAVGFFCHSFHRSDVIGPSRI